MSAGGWRCAVVESAAALSLRDGFLVIGGEQERELPLSQLGTLVIADARCSVSGRLLNELAARGVSVILCDGKRNPCCEVLSLCIPHDSAGCIMDQAAWDSFSRDRVWACVVQAKIRNQIRVLQYFGQDVPSNMEAYASAVLPGDPDNREGQAARVYFRTLFGTEFQRHADDNVNAALNYGYAILCSAVSRCVVSHGYHTALGIHHKSRTNHYNLSCDIMEPFRPFIDLFVRENGQRLLDWNYKLELIARIQAPCIYGKRRMKLQTALELYTLDMIKAMKKPEHQLREISFE